MLTEIHKGALQDGACPCSPLFHVQFFFPLLTLLTHSSPTPTTRKVSSIKQLPTDLPMRHPITGRAWLLWCLTGDPFSNHHSPPRPTLPQPLVNCARSNSDKNPLTHSMHNVSSLQTECCLIYPHGF